MHYLQRRVKTRHYLGVNPLPWGLITVHNQNKGKDWLNGTVCGRTDGTHTAIYTECRATRTTPTCRHLKGLNGRDTYPFNRDHFAMQFCAMKVLNTLSGFICRGHGYKTIAAPAWAASICHHFGTNNLQIQDVYSNTSSMGKQNKKRSTKNSTNWLQTSLISNYGGEGVVKKFFFKSNSTKH